MDFELRLFFPKAHPQRAGGPVTVSVLLEDDLLVGEDLPCRRGLHHPPARAAWFSSPSCHPGQHPPGPRCSADG